jgi:uncharacterized membrane-anchored protein
MLPKGLTRTEFEPTCPACLRFARRQAFNIARNFMNDARRAVLSKVPEVTLGFWIIKVLATTLGETGGDAVTMSMNLGYAIGTMIFFGMFVVAVTAQVWASRFNPYLYWLTIVATTSVGTTFADFADRSLGIGYAGGSSLLLALLIGSLAIWRWSEGSVSVDTVNTPRVEAFYWTTILFSQTLGTALGDWMADTNGLGFGGGALVFGAAILVTAALYHFTNISRVALFWVAFILTRPLGATVGDLLDKPHALGGLALSRYYASAVLIAAILALIVILPQRAGAHPSTQATS